MATPFLYLLPSTARLAYPFVLSGVKRGLSSRAIEQTIRSAGIPISRARTILPMMRELDKLEIAGRNIRFIPKAKTINVNHLPESLTHIRREFSYSVRITGYDDMGLPVDRFVTVSTDNPALTPRDIEAAAEDMVSEGGQSATVYDVTGTLQAGVRRGNPFLV